jgi:hypothetical protein
MDAVRAHPQVIEVLQRFQPGDAVGADMVGTERQVFARIYTTATSLEDSQAVLRFIHQTVVVHDESGVDMVLDRYQKGCV